MKRWIDAARESRWFLPGLLLSTLMRLIPRRLRFRSALLVARVVTPLFSRSGIVRGPVSRIATPSEIVIYPILHILTRNGIEFDPSVRIVGLEHLESARSAGRGVLMVGVHTLLTALALRKLYDRGTNVIVVTTAPPGRILGTSLIVPTIQPSFTFFLEIRNILRGNGVVCAFVDRTEDQQATFEIPTERGTIFIADGVLRVAAQCGAPVVFVSSRLIAGEVVITYGGLSPHQSWPAEAITTAFTQFVRNHVAQLGGTSP